MTYVTVEIDISAHHNHLRNLEECLWIFGCSKGQVCERPDGDDSYGVRLVLSEQPEDLLVAGFLRRSKVRVGLLQFLGQLGLLRITGLFCFGEKSLPCFRGC